MPGCDSGSAISSPNASPTESLGAMWSCEQTDADILFFDESIVEKHNRSKFAKKRPTPFLDQNLSETTTFVAPCPDQTQLPAGDVPYRYPFWPSKLDPSLFNEPRITKSLLKSDSARRRTFALRMAKRTVWDRNNLIMSLSDCGYVCVCSSDSCGIVGQAEPISRQRVVCAVYMGSGSRC